MKKKFVMLFLGIIAAILFVFLNFVIEFVYVGPYVNTDNLFYISKAVKNIDAALDDAMRNSYVQNSGMRFLYKNAYGSGFIKYNPIPNDLDYEVAIYLGKFQYDGNNSKDAAEQISKRIGTFEYKFFVYLDNEMNKKLYTDMNSVQSLISISQTRNENESLIKEDLPKVFGDKQYIAQRTITLPGVNKTVRHSFLMENNEILLGKYRNVLLYGKNVKYNKYSSDFLREVRLSFNYFAQVENTKTGKSKYIALVPQNYNGRAYQLSRRFFVPSVYVDENSAKFLSDIKYLISDEDYFTYRLFDLGRYLEYAADTEKQSSDPLKVFKSLIQTTDLIAPVLSDNEKTEVYQLCYENLNSNISKSMNDYIIAFDSLTKLSEAPKLYLQLNDAGEIGKFIKSMRNSLDSIKDEKTVNKKLYAELCDFQKTLDNSLVTVKTIGEVGKLHSDLTLQGIKYKAYASQIITSNLKDKNKINVYIKKYNTIFENAGYHLVNLYWHDENNVGVAIEAFTAAMTPADLRALARENNINDNVNLTLVNKADENEMTVKYSVWLRYKPTPQQQGKYALLKKKMLLDQENYKIKRKFVFCL